MYRSNPNPARSQWSRTKWLIGLLAIALLAVAGWYLWERFSPPKPFGKVVTIAGTGARIGAQKTLSDPFGVAADGDDIYVTDGLGGSLYRVSLKGEVELITDQLDMPSHLAVAPDGSLIVANTGAHTIVKVDPDKGQVNVIAGAPNVSGNADGKASEAKFNAPIGVAVDQQGVIYIADTYNDRIRKIERDGLVKTLAGSTTGMADGQGISAQFNTPCGIALWGEEDLLVADSGNGVVRIVRPDGTVSTHKVLHELSDSTGYLFSEPRAILTYGASEFYILDSRGIISYVKIGAKTSTRAPSQNHYDDSVVYPLVEADHSGLSDGDLPSAQFNRPTSLVLVGKNTLVVADSGNGLVRAIVPANAKVGTKSDPALATIKAEDIRKVVPPRWPYDPPEAKREIAGTLGEIRGEVAPDKDAWFHNGLDIPGAYGEQVRALCSERVTLPLAVEGVGGLRERLRLPLLGYIHVRVARDQNDQPLGSFGTGGAIFQRDEKGKVIGVRIPRGTRINAGDVVGTLNAFNHVHLIAGPSAAEVNALAALQLPGLVDTIAPTIEGVRLVNEQGELKAENNQPIVVTGKVQFIVRAYDQADGNAGYRRLGVYQVGYQILSKDGAPLPEYKEPQFNLVFNRLPEDWATVRIAYAAPSQSGYTGKTIFDYIATNTVRDGTAREVGLHTKLSNGEYILRAVVEDFFRNRATKDVRIQIVN
ncbi:MAG TPA: SMP-30/gluconolactonase/LRE family protein [Blastocatellia bacterium]|nr:SMP-30/gluconolactonase/LRE family protein [Blastocatellia bacterium]